MNHNTLTKPHVMVVKYLKKRELKFLKRRIKPTLVSDYFSLYPVNPSSLQQRPRFSSWEYGCYSQVREELLLGWKLLWEEDLSERSTILFPTNWAQILLSSRWTHHTLSEIKTKQKYVPKNFPSLSPSLIINLFLVWWGLSQRASCSVPVIMNGKELHRGIVNSHSQKCAVMHLKKTLTG